MADKQQDDQKKQSSEQGSPKKGSGGKWSVFEIKNNNPKSKGYGAVAYITSSTMSEENIVSRIKTMGNSKTARGGNKVLAKDLKQAAKQEGDKEYKELFPVTTVASGVSEERAIEIQSEETRRAKKVYNQKERTKGAV